MCKGVYEHALGEVGTRDGLYLFCNGHKQSPCVERSGQQQVPEVGGEKVGEEMVGGVWCGREGEGEGVRVDSKGSASSLTSSGRVQCISGQLHWSELPQV